jgi:hypothetical protein
MNPSPNVIRIIQPRPKGWKEHVARTGDKRNSYRVMVWKPQETRTLGNLHVGARIILKWTLKKLDWVGMDCLGI